MSRMGAFLALSLALTGASRAQSLGSIAEVDIIDRDTGAVLDPLFLPRRVLGGRQAGSPLFDRNPQSIGRAPAGGNVGRRRQCRLGSDRRLGSNRIRVQPRVNATRSPAGARPIGRLPTSRSRSRPIPTQSARGARRTWGSSVSRCSASASRRRLGTAAPAGRSGIHCDGRDRRRRAANLGSTAGSAGRAQSGIRGASVGGRRPPVWRSTGTAAEARHGARRARILLRESHGVLENAGPAERDHPDSL